MIRYLRGGDGSGVSTKFFVKIGKRDKDSDKPVDNLPVFRSAYQTLVPVNYVAASGENGGMLRENVEKTAAAQLTLLCWGAGPYKRWTSTAPTRGPSRERPTSRPWI